MKVVERQDRLDAAGAQAVFVVHDDPDLIRETMLEDLEVPFPVLVDLHRDAYRDWGIRRAGVTTIFLDPGVWMQYAKLLVGGSEKLRTSGRDPLQMGGDFIVAPDGTLAYSRPQRKDDRPPVGRLVDLLHDVAQDVAQEDRGAANGETDT